MAEERDPRVSRRYRELAAEEPPRELDQAILAAAHRAADHSHAPLVPPVGRHRWYFAFGAAAILVLAVAITVQLDRAQLDSDALTTAPASPVPNERKEPFSSEPGQLADQARARETPAPEARKKPAQAPAPAKPQPAENAAAPQAAEVARVDRLESRREQSLAAEPSSAQPEKKERAPAAPAAQAPSSQTQGRDQSSAVEGALMGNDLQARRSREAAAPAAPPPEATARPQAQVQSGVVASIAPPLGPEQLLDRIAQLRREGRNDEADKALEAFRKHYPDYRTSEEMRKKVERPK